MAEGRVFPPNVMYAVRTLFPLNAMMHVFGLYSSPVHLSVLCLAHGVNAGSDSMSHSRLLSHVFSGQCSIRFCCDRYVGCVELAGTYEDPAAFHADLLLVLQPILQDQPYSVLQDVTVTLGISDNPATVAQIMDGLATIDPAPLADMLGDVTSILDDLDMLPDDILLTVARSHGIEVRDDSRAFLIDIVGAHINMAACARRLCGEGGEACAHVRAQMASEGCMTSTDVDVFQMQLLHHLTKRVKIRSLQSLCRTHGLTVNADDHPGRLRCKLGSYITNLAKAKRVPRAQARERWKTALTEQEDVRRQVLDDARASWPSQLPPLAKEELVRGFRHETSSERLRTFVCASCTASYPHADERVVPFEDISLDLFRCPTHLWPFLNRAVGLPQLTGPFNDIILSPASVEFVCDHPVSTRFCEDCASSVRRGKCPPLAVVNSNFLGDCPDELDGLTFIEEQILALCRAKCAIVHLKDSGDREQTSSGDEDFLDSRAPNDQRGFKGHIIVYPQ